MPPDPLPAPNQWVQLLGAGAILLAFLLLQTGRTAPHRPRYLLLNAVGAGLLAVEAGRTGQLGFFALEATWAVVSVAALLRRPPRLDSPPPSG